MSADAFDLLRDGAPGPRGPVQQSRDRSLPMPILEAAYTDYAARYGTSQSLERLNERGGFSVVEVICHLYNALQRAAGGDPR